MTVANVNMTAVEATGGTMEDTNLAEDSALLQLDWGAVAGGNVPGGATLQDIRLQHSILDYMMTHIRLAGYHQVELTRCLVDDGTAIWS